MAGRAVRLGLTQTVCVEETIRALSRAAQQVDRQVGVHLKLDTGMGRLGVDPSEAVRFALVIAESPGVRLEGIFSHLATAEADDEAYARLQFVRYEAAVRGVREAGIEPGMRHIANSAATVRFPEMRLDGIRTGLLIYGIPPEAGGQGPLELQPALTWKTRVAFARTVPAGSSISYGRTYHTRQTAVIATLPIGYADGYPRRASNRGQVFLRGRRCPIVGTVCMDYMMIDTTPAGGVSLGDEVVLLGEQGSERITAHDLAVSAETCVHEVSTVIGRRVGRTYIDCDSP
jgi:alanine racemase